MHSAPSVTYPVGRLRFMAKASASLWLAGALTVAGWSLQASPPGWHQALAWAAAVASGLSAWLGWRRTAAGQLGWDGQDWLYSTGATRLALAGAPAVAFDLQGVLLVCWQGARGTRWLWLERWRAPQGWADLRRAVYSRARVDALTPDGPDTATP